MGDKWLRPILVAGFIFYVGWTAFVVTTDRPVDFYTYVIAGYSFSHGTNIYLSHDDDAYELAAEHLNITNYSTPYQYPLLTALVVWPLTLLPSRIAAAVWVFSSGIAALASAVMLGVNADQPWKRRLIVIAVLGYAPIVSTIGFGQVNAFVLLATSTAIHAWRRHRERLGGISLALGLWLKPLPVGLVGLMVWRKRLQTLSWLLFASLIITVGGLLAFGLGPTLMQVSATGAALDWVSLNPLPSNQNLNGLVARWFTPHQIGGHPLVSAPQIALPIYWGLVVAFGLLLLVVLWPTGSRGRPVELEAALLITTTHLLSPLTEYYHLTMVFVAIAVLIEKLQSRRPSVELLALLTAYLFIDIQAVLLTSFENSLLTLNDPILRQLTGQTLLLDFAVWAQVIVWALLVIQLRKKSRCAGYQDPLSFPRHFNQ